MKKLALCECCEEFFSCQAYCEDALKWEPVEGEKNRIPDREYENKGVSATWGDQKINKDNLK